MKVEKEYFNLTEAAKVVGNCTDLDLIHHGASGKLPIYVIPNHWHVHLYEINSADQTDAYYDTTKVQQEPIQKSIKPFLLTKPVKLYQSTLMRLEMMTPIDESHFIAPDVTESDEFDHCEYQIFDPNTKPSLPKVQVSRSTLVVMKEDLQGFLEDGAVNDKPLATKERNTLLLIIAALSKQNGIDLTHPSAAAAVIKGSVELMGRDIGQTTIENHIKRIDLELVAQTKPKPKV